MITIWQRTKTIRRFALALTSFLLLQACVHGTQNSSHSGALTGNGQYVNVGALNLRECPSTTCRIVSILHLGDEVIPVEWEGRWFLVHVQKNGKVGWVAQKYIAETQPHKKAKKQHYSKYRPESSSTTLRSTPAQSIATDNKVLRTQSSDIPKQNDISSSAIKSSKKTKDNAAVSYNNKKPSQRLPDVTEETVPEASSPDLYTTMSAERSLNAEQDKLFKQSLEEVDVCIQKSDLHCMKRVIKEMEQQSVSDSQKRQLARVKNEYIGVKHIQKAKQHIAQNEFDKAAKELSLAKKIHEENKKNSK